MFIKSITSFDEIELKSHRPLIICDIDNTILHHDVKIEKFIDILKNDGFCGDELLSMANEMMSVHCRIYPPVHTDKHGYNNFLKKIKELNGEIIFLTARDRISEDFTSKHFRDIGLNYSDYKVYYTANKVSKGQYIKDNINIMNWNEVIFIDDYDFQIKSVVELIPWIYCYKFEII